MFPNVRLLWNYSLVTCYDSLKWVSEIHVFVNSYVDLYYKFPKKFILMMYNQEQRTVQNICTCVPHAMR